MVSWEKRGKINEIKNVVLVFVGVFVFLFFLIIFFKEFEKKSGCLKINWCGEKVLIFF